MSAMTDPAHPAADPATAGLRERIEALVSDLDREADSLTWAASDPPGAVIAAVIKERHAAAIRLRAALAAEPAAQPADRVPNPRCERCRVNASGLGSSARCVCGPNVPCWWCGQGTPAVADATPRGLAERTTSLDSQRVRLAGLEVPEAQAQTTVPVPSDAQPTAQVDEAVILVVLNEHNYLHVRRCKCGWTGPGDQFRAHVAAAVAARLTQGGAEA